MSQIFTKTLTIQVWRPEFERPGRHFVYTTRYVYFFVSLLDQLDDRASLDQLLRRVRKKQGDFINHTKLWEDVCLTYAKMIRRAASISEGHEEGVFRPIGWEEFSSKTARLEGLGKLSDETTPVLELMRDSLELKKLNNNLMKVTMFEDLVADLYARIYQLNMPQLIEQVNEENKEKMKVDHLLMTGEGTTETSTPATPVPASDTPAPRGRTKGIARRDIQKRADMIVNLKLGPRTATTKFAATTDAEQAPATPRGLNAANVSGSTSTPQDLNKQGPTTGDDANAEKENVGSAHDSGNESDADETDDVKTNKPPKDHSALTGLRKNELGEVETENEDDAGSDGEGEGEGEEEEEEGDEDEGEGEGEGDIGTTELETGGEEAQDVDNTVDEDMQDEDGEDHTIDESKILDGENDESTQATDYEREGSATTIKNEEAEKDTGMDTTPA
jgi:hypothetical protein